MDIYELLMDFLQTQYNNGKTETEIANDTGLSQQQVNALRNKKRSFAKMRLETLLRMFPNIRISLDGSPITATNSAVNAGVNNGNMTIHAVGDGERLKSSLRSAILKTDDICDKCKVKILTLLETV